MKARCSKCQTVFEAEPDENYVLECPSCGARMRVRPKTEGSGQVPVAAPPPAAAPPPPPSRTPSSEERAVGGVSKLPAVMRANKVIAGRTCPACGQDIALGQEVHNCETCATSHHAPCWDQGSGCTSCAAKPAVAAVGAGEEPASAGGDTQPCKYCGEQIKVGARKCRFCGEYQNLRDRNAQEQALKVAAGIEEDMTSLDWVLAILCATIGCIVGIVYCIQGKKKGPKMVGISILVAVIWNVIIAAANLKR